MHYSKLLKDFLTPLKERKISVFGFDETCETGRLIGFDKFSIWINDTERSKHLILDLENVDTITSGYNLKIENNRNELEENL
jgi:hypothetical protein